MKKTFYLSIIIVLLSSCVVVQPHEVAVKKRFGKLKEKVYGEGPHAVLLAKYQKVPIRNMNLRINLQIPSKEGLTISSEMSVLYRIKKDRVLDIIREVGMSYDENLIAPVFRSALANTSAKFFAKDMHSGKRQEIEASVKKQMIKELGDRGFIIEAVLMKRIVLPAGLSKAIEEKLEAEQDAQRMEFTLQKQRKEAERTLIEAEGRKKVAIIEAEAKRDQQMIDAEADKNASILRAEGTQKANQLINSGLSEEVLRLRAIEAFEKLSVSQNSKTIITDGGGQILNIDSKK